MNGSIRVSAKTVDDAVTEALIQLGVTSDKIEYEVIEKGSAGFLGIGMKQAVIEVWKKPEERKKPVYEGKEDNEEKPVRKAESFETAAAEKAENEAEAGTEQADDVLGENSEKKERAEKKEYHREYKEDKPYRSDRKKDYRSDKRKDDRGRYDRSSRSNYGKKNDNYSYGFEEESVKKPEIVLAEVQPQTMEAVEKFLKDTINAMGIEVEIQSSIDSEGNLCVELSGEQMGILIGKRGQTLDSLQYLAVRVANKQQEGYVRVKLDTENYRARREETLQHLAKNIARKVKKTRRPVVLEPMNPYERRIIHSTLQSDPYVTTHSEGEEPYRKVVVTLKR